MIRAPELEKGRNQVDKIKQERINMPKLHVEERYCKGCGICIEFCPVKILKKSQKMNSRGYFPPESSEMGKCKKCGMCSLLCPDFAIVVESE